MSKARAKVRNGQKHLPDQRRIVLENGDADRGQAGKDDLKAKTSLENARKIDESHRREIQLELIVLFADRLEAVPLFEANAAFEAFLRVDVDAEEFHVDVRRRSILTEELPAENLQSNVRRNDVVDRRSSRRIVRRCRLTEDRRLLQVTRRAVEGENRQVQLHRHV